MEVPKPSSKPQLPKRYTDFLPATSAKDREVNSVLIFTYWDEGGSNPFSGTMNNPSGVAISIGPATRKNGTYSYAVTAGLRYIAAPAPRMSRKLILSARDRCLYEIEKKLGKGWEVLQKVLEREQITLKP